jgi:hypothetical protein
MSAAGIVYKDLVDDPTDPTITEYERQSAIMHNAPKVSSTATPAPAPTSLPTGTEYVGKSTSLTDAPTDSHALAMQGAKATHPAERGAAQVQHGEEVVDLGWNEPKELVAKPLVGGLSNEDLWLLVRRFNKVCNLSPSFEDTVLISCSKCTMSRKSPLHLQEAWI